VKTRAEVHFEHAAAEKDAVRYPARYTKHKSSVCYIQRMDVTEESDNRLVIVSKTTLLTYIGGLAIVLGLWLILHGQGVENYSPVYTFFVGPIGILAGIYTLVSPIKCTLSVDKNLRQLSIKKAYLFGLVPLTRRVELADLVGFAVQHQLAYKLRPAILKLLFKTARGKLTFSSGRLHFADGSGLLDPGAYDPRNSSEEALIPVIANYIGIPATPKERAIDTTILNRRLFYRSLIFIGGFVVALAGIWVYFHLIHTN